jgi:uncharacterized protein
VTIMSATYSVAGTLNREPSTTASGFPPVWGLLATLIWFQVAAVASLVAGVACLLGFLLWSSIAPPDVALKLDSPALGYLCYAMATTGFGFVLAHAARLTGWSARDYFGLVLPKLRYIPIGFGALFAYAILVCLMTSLFPWFDQSTTMIQEYREAADNVTGLLLFWFVFVAVAPVIEELAFRGFMFRGFSESRLGFGGTILLTSLIWASFHLRYNVALMTQVFCGGLLFGIIRWRSGSTALTILLHATWNLVCVVRLALLV